MSAEIPTTQWNLTFLVNLVILGLLINSYYYFGLRGAVITFVLVLVLVPISEDDILVAENTTEE